MKKQTSIGSVPYLNARPLVRWFSDTPEGRESGIEVVEAVPSALAAMLERRELAVALVSSFEMLRRPSLSYVPSITIAADGPVLSVRLLSKVPIPEIRSVALDTSSLTSVALLKILLSELYGLTPAYIPAAPDLVRMLAEADAALLIGDPGYREYGPEYHVLDLGEGWKRLTGLPFVYALWIGHGEAIDTPLIDVLTKAREWGTAHLTEIAEKEYEQLGETYERTYDYLTRIMRYDLGDNGRESLRQFAEKSYAHGLLPAPVDTDAMEATRG